ncbi:MAG: hypothetical protein ACTHM8_01230 [Sphingomonas sp.]
MPMSFFAKSAVLMPAAWIVLAAPGTAQTMNSSPPPAAAMPPMQHDMAHPPMVMHDYMMQNCQAMHQQMHADMEALRQEMAALRAELQRSRR